MIQCVHWIQSAYICRPWFPRFVSIFLKSLTNEILKSSKRKAQTWWRHQMETFSASLALCEGNHRVRYDITVLIYIFFYKLRFLSKKRPPVCVWNFCLTRLNSRHRKINGWDWDRYWMSKICVIHWISVYFPQVMRATISNCDCIAQMRDATQLKTP